MIQQVLGKDILQLTKSSHLSVQCIVELLLCHGRRLFCTFVDYSKAFDSINRATLWKQLFSYGITGKVIYVITNMYKSINSWIVAYSQIFFNHM